MSENENTVKIPKWVKKEIEQIVETYGKDFERSKAFFNELLGWYKKGNTWPDEINIKVDGTTTIEDFKKYFTKSSDSKYIDQFSFLYMIYRFGPDNRIIIANKLSQPDSKHDECLFLGIPSTKQGAGAIYEKSDKVLYDKINEINDSDGVIKLFDEKEGKKLRLTPKGITLGGFMCYPEDIMPLDSKTMALLSYLGFDSNINSADDYRNLLKDVKAAFGYDGLQGIQKYFFNAISYLGYKIKEMTELNELLKINKHVILHGAPGTSKTYTVQQFEKYNSEGCVFEKCQFHPSFTYEDFMEGFKPVSRNNGMELELKNGIFKQFVKKAYEDKDSDKKYYFFIDEINRAELSRVFGELLFCLENRIKVNEKGEMVNLIKTQYFSYLDSLESDDEKAELSIFGNKVMSFGIPENVHIIGTMNDIDRSVDNIDMAFRRRFVWHEMTFDEERLRMKLTNVVKINTKDPFFQQKDITEILEFAQKINDKIIKQGLSSDFKIGHTYFMDIDKYYSGSSGLAGAKKKLWQLNIKPLIKEYLRTILSLDEIGEKLDKMAEELKVNE
ncbi:MAG TPA: AAA family ATPase [Saprospiraceae bacterium]|nr:AAA family ATPase [Saprospiraceae bacterium]